MFNEKNLPSNTAEQLNDNYISSFDKNMKVTFTEKIDEKKLYNDINKRLIALETSLDANENELSDIQNMVQKFQFARDDKSEIAMRVEWLNRLYYIHQEIKQIENKDNVQYLRKIISSVQTCPLKNHLLTELSVIEQSLPEENVERLEYSNEKQLMESAIEKAGDEFINLGKTGREYVISNVIEKFGDNAKIENVKDFTTNLEQRVSNLSDVTNRNEMIDNLEQLPLKSFEDLSDARKEAIADRLIENNKWNGLAVLNRQITQVDRAITKEEQEKEESRNTFSTGDGKAAFTLNVDGNENKFIDIE